MEIRFNIEKSRRRALALKIAELTGAEITYLGVPSCGYQIDFFTLSKDAVLSFSDRSDTEIVETVLNGLAEAGYDRQIQPSLPGWNVCNIANPDSIWLRNLKIPVQQIRCNRMGMPGVGGALVCEFAHGLDMQLPHQPINPLSGADHFPPDHVKQGVQPGGWLLLMQGDELTGQPLILLFSGADAPMKPGVVAAAGDFQKPA